jgi:hypothetical protein
VGPLATGTSHPWRHDDDPVGRHADAAQVIDEALRRDYDPGRRAVRDAVEPPLRDPARSSAVQAARWLMDHRHRPGVRSRAIHGAANAAAMLSSRIASEPSAAARSARAPASAGSGQASAGMRSNRTEARWSGAAAAIMRW